MRAVVLFLVVLVASISAQPPNARVIGGQAAKIGQFPFMAALVTTSNVFHCGASIVAKRWILTAGHCVEGFRADQLTVLVGTTTLSAGGVVHKVAKIKLHYDYHSALLDNDIALIELASDITFDSVTQPIGFGSASANDSCILSGWGRITPRDYPDELQYVNLRILSEDECVERWTNPNPPQEVHVCTFTKEGEGACFGDSGGPLTANGALVGIVSFGIPCAGKFPDVYTRISFYTDWIYDNMH